MKKKFTFSVMALFMSITTWADSPAPVSLHVHQSSGSVYSAALEDVIKLNFDAGDLVIQSVTTQNIPLTGIRKVTFSRPSTAVSNVQATDCNIFVNANKMLVINAAQPISNLQIVSLTGQVIMAKQYSNQPYQLEESVQSLMQGTYLVLLQTENGTANAKVMIR